MPTAEEIEAETVWAEAFAPSPIGNERFAPPAIPIPAAIEALNLPVMRQIGGIDFDAKNIVAVSATGSGKSVGLAPYELLLRRSRGEHRRILMRQPTRVSCFSIYRALGKLWEGSGLTFGVCTARNKENLDADIILYSDGSLSGLLADAADPIVYFDEAHSMGVDLAEIELAMCKMRGIPVRALSATIDPKTVIDYFGPGTGNYELSGRTFPIEKKVMYCDETLFDHNKNAGPLEEVVGGIVGRIAWEGKRALVFGPTKAISEHLAAKFSGICATTFAHGEVYPEDLLEWVDDHAGQPSVIFCTIALATGVTLPLDEVFIIDERVSGGVRQGVTQSYHIPYDSNTAIQCAGRVGRTHPGVATLITTEERRPNGWDDIRAMPIEPPCAKSTPYGVVLSLASVGFRDFENAPLLSKLEPGEVRHARKWLEANRCISPDGGILTMGQRVRAFPMDVTRAHLVLSAPSQSSKLITLAALTVGEKGTFSLLRVKPGKMLDAELLRNPGFQLLPPDCIHPDSMPLTLAKLMQRALHARDRSNKTETLAGWCHQANVSERAIRFAMTDFEEAAKHIVRPRASSDDEPYTGRRAFLDVDIDRFAGEVNDHLAGHREFVGGRFASRSDWGPTDLGNGIVDGAAKHLFRLGGTAYSAVGIPKEVRARSGSTFISLELPIIHRAVERAA